MSGQFFRDQDTDSALTYLPLHVGNEWIYDAKVGGEECLMAFRVTEATKIPGEVAFVMESGTTDTPAESRQREYLAVQGGDVFLLRVENAVGVFTYEPKQCILKHGLAPGICWDWEGTVRDIVSVHEWSQRMYASVCGYEPVETGAGRVVAMRLRIVTEGATAFSGSAMRITRWYARGVGMVQELGELDGTVISLAILRRYRVKALRVDGAADPDQA